MPFPKNPWAFLNLRFIPLLILCTDDQLLLNEIYIHHTCVYIYIFIYICIYVNFQSHSLRCRHVTLLWNVSFDLVEALGTGQLGTLTWQKHAKAGMKPSKHAKSDAIKKNIMSKNILSLQSMHITTCIQCLIKTYLSWSHRVGWFRSIKNHVPSAPLHVAPPGLAYHHQTAGWEELWLLHGDPSISRSVHSIILPCSLQVLTM